MVNGDLPDFAVFSNSGIKKTFHLHFEGLHMKTPNDSQITIILGVTTPL